MRLPNFIGLGAQKAGTTSLHYWLSEHPNVFIPASKELQFFTLHHKRGLEWYQSCFAGARPEQQCGDITPYYLFHPTAPERIKAVAPDAKLIVLLRDPVERTLSGLFHSIRLGFEPLEPLPALEAEAERLERAEAILKAGHNHFAHQEQSYVSRSCYEVQIKRYLDQFSRDQLLLVRSEDLFSAEPQDTLKSILSFLELPPNQVKLELPRDNPGKGEAVNIAPSLRQWLRARLAPTYSAMERMYGIQWETHS